MKDYDVVVVGAGLGGLSAATFLSKEGKRVLLIERQSVPGGYASSFIRGRFEFEVSLHELSGLGTTADKGPLYRLLDSAGVLKRVEFLPIPEFYRSVFPDIDMVVPIGREAFEEALVSNFPGEAEGLRQFSNTLFDFAEEAVRANRIGMKEVMKDPASYPTLMAHFGKTLADVLNPMVYDEKARAVLGQAWGYYCQPPSLLSFLIYALGTAGYLRFGPWHIKGRSQALSQAFVDSIEENGGEVWLNKGAARIMTRDGAVRGVVTEDGTEIACPVVVSNANPVLACLGLIGRESIPSWYLKRLGAGTGGASTFNVYMGLDCDAAELGLTNHENFVNRTYDLDEHGELMRRGIGVEPPEAAVTNYNAVDPDFSPPGTSVVVITLINYSEPWLELPPEKYAETKNLVADRVIELAELVAPGVRDHIEVVEVATPLTNARYTGNLAGSIIGFDETYKGTGLVRMPNRGPLDGLYFAGSYAFIGGGYEPSIVSGFQASREVLQDMERGGRDAAVMEKVRGQAEEQAGDAPEVDDDDIQRVRHRVWHWHPSRLELRVAKITEETASAKTLRLVTTEWRLPNFRAGQYINVFLDIDGVQTSRPYSIASPPGTPYFDVTVRRTPHGFVSDYLLDRVKPGDVFETTGPNGNFYYEPLMDTGELVFLAGGSGITPFMSIIREAAEKRPPFTVHLIYGSRDPSDIIFEAELKELSEKHPSLTVDFVISEPHAAWQGACGLLDARMISSLAGSVEGKTFYVCGPEQMYELCGGALESLGVPGRRVRREVYGPPVDVTLEPGWPGVLSTDEFSVTEERSGRTVKAKPTEPLMNSLERDGLVVPALCRSGECAACRTRLIEGEIFAPERVHRRWIDERAGYIHPCMSYPLSDLRIRI
jgi:prolycopene isomerase